MIHHELIAPIVVFTSFFTAIVFDVYQRHGIVEPESSEHLCTFPLDNIQTLGNMSRYFDTYSHLPNFAKAEFNQLCKNLTEVYDCLAMRDFTEREFDRTNIGGYFPVYITCNLPNFKTVRHLCNLTFDDAVNAQKCFNAARSHYSGSPEEAKCREICCHDPSTFNDDQPTVCGLAENDIYGSWNPCKNHVHDQSLKDNDCLKACLAKSWSLFAKKFCGVEAVRVFEVYEEEIEKKALNDQCFRKCPEDIEY